MPSLCRKFLLLKIELLRCKHNLRASIIQALFSYHPLNLGSFKMTDILQTTQLERNLFKIENKITRHIQHRSFLKNYRNNRKYLKGLSLKFNLTLYSDAED